MVFQVESSLAVLIVVGFITVLVYNSIISPKIASQDDFLSNQVIKRQIFCFLVCTPPFYIVTLSITRIVFFPENLMTFVYEVYRCSRGSSSSLDQICNNFDEVIVIYHILITIITITRGFMLHCCIQCSYIYF